MEFRYDVFISFKNRSADNAPSVDAVLGEELYRELSQRGIRVFFSNVKLLELGEATYKRAIEEALDQSRVLIAILSCQDYVHSKWVEYERESFHEDILAGRNDGVIVPYLGSELTGTLIPRSLRNYESFEIGKHSVKEVCDFVAAVLQKKNAGRAPETENTAGRTSLTTGKTMSVYSPEFGKEFKRLRIQSKNTRAADMPVIEGCMQALNKDRVYILDAGCAYGYVTKDRFGDFDNVCVLGVDANENCLEYARKNNEDESIFYEKLNLEGEDLEDELEELMDRHGIPKFDIIFSSLVIHHLKNPNKFLRRIRKFLSKGGYIILRGSDDGSVMTYNDDGLIEKVISLHLSCDGISDRENGRKLYHQLVTSGYKNVQMHSYIKDISALDMDERYEIFLERFSYRKNYLKIVAEKEPYNMEKRNNYEYMKILLEQLENKFADESFWYCETDFVGVAQKT